MRKADIDVTFDIRSDANGKDPDRHSPTLRNFHRLLWSKPLPDGTQFDLDDRFPNGYLLHASSLGEFALSSDMIHRTFRRVRRYESLISRIPETFLDEFSRRGCTIGGTIVFPSNKIDGKHTINQARGIHRRIEDRFDLTLECIRRHYSGKESPLAEVLARYSAYFSLFTSFDGYVSHFLLQDLVDDGGNVRFFTTWDDFSSPPMPPSVEEYMEYGGRALSFVDARNERIREWCASQPHTS